MRRRHPLPRLWLMTDERMADPLASVAALPRGSGVIFRHYATPHRERARLLAAVRKLARRRDLTLLIAGVSHNGPHRAQGLRSAAVHSPRELAYAHRAGVNLVFISPIFATRSHPEARPLGIQRAATLVRHARVPAIALGGMTPRRWRQLQALGFHGWAAIDALAVDRG